MLHVNDDSNDELFRRAAENYPLKTDGSDWKSVEEKMTAGVPGNQKKKLRKGGYWPLLLLLLLIPLKMYETRSNAAGSSQTTGIHKSSNAKQTAPVIDQQISSPDNEAFSATDQPNQISLPVQSASILNTGSQEFKRNHTVSSKNDKTVKDFQANEKASFTTKQKTKAFITNVLPENDEKNPDNVSAEDRAWVTREKTHAVITNVDNISNDSLSKIAGVKKDKNNIKLTEVVTVTPGKKVTTDKRHKRHSKHFYIGIVAGPDFSTIKLQSVKKTGLNYGFIAGYRISKKLSIETGLLKDRKFYSTDGKYFNTKEIYLPGYSMIEYVEGECNMLEIPINLYYTFYQRTRSGVYASAGLSSYFMKNESYVYDINHNGVRYPRSAQYDKKSTSLAAVINISAGYSYKLGKICDLRIEPYVKLPINKIGTGSLPIQSGGILIGITKNIF